MRIYSISQREEAGRRTKEVPKSRETLTTTEPRFASIVAFKSMSGNLGMIMKARRSNRIPIAKLIDVAEENMMDKSVWALLVEGTAMGGYRMAITERRIMDEAVLMIGLVSTGPTGACWWASTVIVVSISIDMLLLLVYLCFVVLWQKLGKRRRIDRET